STPANTGALYSSQSGQKVTDVASDLIQTFSITNSTLYNIAYNKNVFTHRQNSQKWETYIVKNNVVINCGKKGQFVMGLNGGGKSANPTFDVDNNSFIWETDGVFAVQAETEPTADVIKNSVGEPTTQFTQAAEGIFTIHAGSAQAKAQVGAPKWLVAYDAAVALPAPVVVSPATGEDLTVAVAAAKETVDKVGNITINLAENGAYTVSGSIEIPAGLVINGNGATIDASALEAPFILMSETPAVDAINDYYRVGAITISNVTVNGIKNSIFYDNNVKYCVVDFTIDNSTLALATTAVQNEALISFKNGGAKDFTVKNSTIYGNGDVAKYFIRYNNNARLDRYGFDTATDFQTMTYTCNTFYNLLKSDGQWGNYNGIGGQKYSKFDVQKNIWVDCGKDIIRRMAGGRFNGSNPMEFAYNTYFEDGVNLAASEASYDKSETILYTNPDFADAAAGNFTIGAGTQQAKYQTGAPKWLVEYNKEEAVAVPLTVSPATGEDLTAAIAAAKEAVDKVSDITINLAKDGNYTISASIETGAGLVINGNGATIDASSLEAPFILMSETPVAELISNFNRVGAITISNVTVNGIKNSIFYDNNTPYCVVDFTIDNSTLALATTAVQNEALVSFKAGGVKDLTVKNSTIYGNGDVA
ncbi:MAG: DUF4957 domain-containing protein, partial [Duncaniella sp.]|nr:DUF4957 domain-containing protein [Duncaniella sp.]